MKRALIATVDAARARIYTYQEDAKPGSELREVQDLTNPGRRLPDRELFSESRPSLSPSGMVGPNVSGGPAKDDHRDDHIAMMDTKFAKEIVEELDRIVRTEGYGHLILLAPPKMLGTLRKANGIFKRGGLAVDEVPRDLSNLTAAQLHDHLASLGMVPGRQRAGLQGRPLAHS
jgi:protein required for attachment to host cells